MVALLYPVSPNGLYRIVLSRHFGESAQDLFHFFPFEQAALLHRVDEAGVDEGDGGDRVGVEVVAPLDVAQCNLALWIDI